MSYLHIDIQSIQSPKYRGSACGDVVGFERDKNSTTIVLSDGIGSGIKANIAANLCVSRILTLIRNGATLREAFTALVNTMNKAWGTDKPFAVFTLARILNNGDTTILSYEIPPPILISGRKAKILTDRIYTIGKAVISETNCNIEKNDGLLLVSDGITQAGMGMGLLNGWETEGIVKYLNTKLIENTKLEALAEKIHSKARKLWGNSKGDDCTVLYAQYRNGVVINLITGPPASKNEDTKIVTDFFQSDGIKIVCGGSTAKMVARELRKPLHINTENQSIITPPSYEIPNINLVCEGVVTLNQVYNILDEDISEVSNSSPVYALVEYLRLADRINFWIGDAKNIGESNIEFRQQGLLPRHKITALLVQKLKQMGKLVVIQ